MIKIAQNIKNANSKNQILVDNLKDRHNRLSNEAPPPPPPLNLLNVEHITPYSKVGIIQISLVVAL